MALIGLQPGTIREIDKTMMEKIKSEKAPEGIIDLGVKEIAVGKGHTCWSVIRALEGSGC
ncbi:MAG: hypothetical protein ACYCYP_08650 [Leptospirales bacterium]